MLSRVLLAYVLVEIAVLIALVTTIGAGRTVLVLLATFLLGLLVAGAQLRRQALTLLRGLRDPAKTLTDSALVALGAVLVVVPGLASSVAGILLLLPPTRAAVRPVLSAVALGRLARPAARSGGGAVIDGEVVDGEVVTEDAATPRALPAGRTP
ncbi:FxsA family protein [Mycobacterium sp. 1274756.6]|uniref:FxsA family protein n=1 Tax=Mycobacterium sp. 1274756.6 TaxID=1834076 RepID=UPI0007FD3C18|nr:FxsA family protein [Mycobacterium sp. 1274756.6]OBJ73614.1 hypothetical protein A5643_03485 [Mycobacterium sp. 1274756.6]